MATSQDILEESEIAKSYVNNSDFSIDYKRVFLKLINTATVATNGITPEEKIQMMTESICLLAQTQVMFAKSVDEKIQKAIESANTKQCDSCKAMKHAIDMQRKADREKLIEQLRQDGVIPREDLTPAPAVDASSDMTWTQILKTVLTKPWAYVFMSIAVFSPYGVQILDRVLQFLAR